MAPAHMASKSYVPAWRRVGLKLKHESHQSVDSPVTASNAVHASKKRKLRDSQPPVPRPFPDLTSSRLTDTSGQHVDDTTADKETIAGGTSRSSASPTTVAKKRKSVTFSPDAKSVDGPSLTLAQTSSPTPSPSHNSKDRSNKASQDNEQNGSSKIQPPEQDHTSHDQLTPYLQYLKHSYLSRDSWKFNKNMQSQLFANIYNLDRVPKSYDVQLRSYLSGLRGASRWRLEEEAKELLRQAQLIDDPSHNIRKTEDAQASPDASDSRKIERATLILVSLPQGRDDRPVAAPSSATVPVANPNEPNATKGSQNPRSGKRSRGRKRRSTGTALELSSSSDSDTDSSSSSSSSSSDSSP